MSDFSRRDVLRTGLVISAGSLLSKSSLMQSEAVAQAVQSAQHAGVILPTPDIDLAPRERLLFDFNWRFMLGHGSDPARDLGFGKGQGDFAKTGDFTFARPKFDDSTWRKLNLPHDWAVELPFVNDDSLDSHGFKPLGRKYPETSVGWYRRTFDISKSDEGRRIFIEFDGAFRSALVFCNGSFLGRSDSGYAPFRFELTDFLSYGASNAIVVRMDASFGDGWFYEGAGIYRHVWLTKVDPVHLGEWDTIVRTEVQGGNATLKLTTTVLNASAAKANCRVRWQILDGAGKSVTTVDSPAVDIVVDGRQDFTATAKIAKPAIWSPAEPNLYYAVATVEAAGKVVDRDKTTFGVRTLAWDAEKGFFLNGERTEIHGTCNHQDHAGVGAALPDSLQDFRINILKGMGNNAVRTSHNIPTPEWVEACDRLGVLMLCETRIMSSNDEAMNQLEKMIKRFRNSPAIFLWSMGNEEFIIQANNVGPHVIRSMQQRSHELDPTRLCTAAVNNSWDKDMAPVLDVMGYNYNISKIDGYHAKYPKQPSIGTETASTVSTRGIYTTDKLRNWVSAYDVNAPQWGETAEQWWSFYAARPFTTGGFVWTGFDYRGEPTPYSWPSINSQFGVIDMCGFQKDNYFYYKAWWGSEPVLHLFPHWNWAGKEGEEIMVWVHSNLDSVELFVNGQSAGSQKIEKWHHIQWSVKYAPGFIEARGTKDGKVVMTTRRDTTGDPAKIVLTADRNEISADGADVSMVRVEVIDKDGRPVPVANNEIHFKVAGEGALIGVGNGDPNCQEADKADERSLFNGLAQAILQATRTAGTITLEANGRNLESAKITVTTMEVRQRPSVA